MHLLSRSFHLFSLLAFALCLGCGPEAAQIPTSYSLYNAKDGTFECDAPDGWEIKGGGKNSSTPVWAKFSSGSALIHIKANSTGPLANAGLGVNVSDPNTPPSWEAVHLIHVADIEMVAEEYEGYTEVAGSPMVMNCSLGPARLSEFTYSATFGAAMHGYRVSIVGHDRGIKIFCTAPENQWKNLQPVYDKFLASLQRGTPE